MLLVASYVFYGAWEWRYLALIIFSTTVDYLCGLQIEKEREKRRKKPYVAISIITNLAMLGTFKYFDFFAASFRDLMANFGFIVHPYPVGNFDVLLECHIVTEGQLHPDSRLLTKRC